MSYRGLPQGSLRPYFSTLENSCAQSAAACVLDHYGKLPSSPATAVADIYQAFPPDNPVKFGTSPGRTEAILHANQLRTRYFNSATANGYGAAQLADPLAHNIPVICIVDNGKLGGAWWAHFVVAFAYDDGGVWITNSIVTHGEQYVPYAQWEEAWHCWFMSSKELQFVGLVPVP